MADSGPAQVVLARPRITEMAIDRYRQLFQDDTFRVIWTGAAYGIERKKDRQMMPGSFANESLAVAGVAALYPRQA